MEKCLPVIFLYQSPGDTRAFLLFISWEVINMKASNSLWREQPLESPLPELVREIEIYET